MIIGRRGVLYGATVLAGGWACAARAQGFAGLSAAFARIEAARGGRLGVTVIDTGSGQRAGYRAEERFPICSTFKLLAAAAVLARAEAGRDSMDRRVRYTRADLVTHSPVTERHLDSGMTLEELCAATMITSDNTAANLMLAALGGPEGLTAWLREIGDPVTRLDRWETALNEAIPGDPRDTSTPAAMAATIQAVTLGEVLGARSRAMLVQWLRDCITGNTRLRAGLPAGWSCGDRTGTGARNTSNDVGLFWPPGGAAPLVVTAYLTQGSPDGKVRDAALADVARAVVAAWSTGR